MTDHSLMKLGKAPAVHDPRTLQLANYLSFGLPKPSPVADYTDKVDIWPMYMNDRLGDCAIASPAHQIEAWSRYAKGYTIKVTDDMVLKGYEDVGGYVPGDAKTDGGCVLLDMLKYLRTTGIGGRQIEAFASVNPKDRILVEDAISMFGGISIGLALPISAQRQTVWSVTGGADAEAGSWGGHAVPVLGYDPRGLKIVTWGAVKIMTWAFFRKYCDEAYALLSEDFLNADDVAPNGFDIDTLRKDLLLIH